MAKRNNNQELTETKTYEIPDVPEGYSEVADDIVGYWNPELHKMIHVIPKEAKIFDNKIDETRVSILVFCKLVDSAILQGKDDQGNEIKVEGKPGDTVGVWGKPGLRQKLINMAGRDCYICVSGTKEIGRPQPMTTFSVKSKGPGKPLPLVEDRRNKSKHAETWWHNEGGTVKSAAADDSEENIPF